MLSITKITLPPESWFQRNKGRLVVVAGFVGLIGSLVYFGLRG